MTDTPGHSGRRLGLNVISGWIPFGAALLTSLMLTPFVLHRTGFAAYGAFLLITSLLGYTSYLYLGLGSAMARYSAHYRANQDWESTKDLAGTVLSVYLAAGAVIVLAAWIAAPFLCALFKIETGLGADAVLALRLLGASIGLAFPASAFSGLLSGHERIAELNLLGLGTLLARVVLTVVLLKPEGVLVTLAVIALCVSALDCVGRIWLAVFLLRICPNPARFRLSVLRQLVGFSLLSFVGDIAERVLFSTDNVVIAAHLPERSVTEFAVPGRLVEYARQLVRRLSYALGPRFALLHSAGDFRGIGDLVSTTGRWAGLIMVPLTCGLVFTGPNFIEVWIGTRIESARWILLYLGLAQLVRSPALVFVSAIWGCGRLRGLALALAIEALVNLGLSLWWIRTWGIIGVAVGTMVPSVIFALVVAPALLQSVAGLRAVELLARIWLRPLSAAAVCALAFWVVPTPLAHGWVGLAARVGIQVAVAAVVLGMIGLTATERAWLVRRFHGRKPGAG